MPQVSKREVVVDAARRRFKINGINATAIEHVIEEAQVSKKTLYNHFKTKEELVLVVLRKDDEIGRNALMRFAENASSEPTEQILAIFDFYDTWFNNSAFNGCLFTNSAGEISSENTGAKKICAEHKILIQQYIEKLAKKANIVSSKKLALELNMLLEGSIVCAYVMQNKNAALEAKEVAKLILSVATA